MKRVLAVVAVRMGSSRLPGKAMMPLAGRPMLERLVERIRFSRCVTDVMLATTELSADDAVADLATRLGVGCFRGSEDDVLGRIDAAIALRSSDVVVQILGDNPLVDPRLIDDVVEFYEGSDAQWVVTATTELPRVPAEMPLFPVGVRVEAFSAEAHRRCAEAARDAHSREHSSSFAHRNPEMFGLEYYPAAGRWAAVSLPTRTFAINYEQNYDMVRQVFEELYPAAADFSLEEAVRLVESRPDLLAGMGAPTPVKAEP